MTRKEAFLLGYFSKWWSEGAPPDVIHETLKIASSLSKIAYFYRDNPHINPEERNSVYNFVRMLTAPNDQRTYVFNFRDQRSIIDAYRRATKEVKEKTKLLKQMAEERSSYRGRQI